MIHLDFDKVVRFNHAIVTFGSFNLVLLHTSPKIRGTCINPIHCKSPKSRQIQVSYQGTLLNLSFDNELVLDKMEA